MSKVYPIVPAFEILFIFKKFEHNRDEKKAHLLVMRLSVCILHFCSSALMIISVFLCRAAAFRSIYCSWRSWYMVWCRVRWSSASTSNNIFFESTELLGFEERSPKRTCLLEPWSAAGSKDDTIKVTCLGFKSLGRLVYSRKSRRHRNCAPQPVALLSSHIELGIPNIVSCNC